MRYLFTRGARGFAAKNLMTLWNCVKGLLLALRAKLYLDGDIFSLILLRKIREKMPPSKECFAATGGKRLFTHPRIVQLSILKIRIPNNFNNNRIFL